MKRTLLIINGEHSHGKTSLVNQLIEKGIISEDNSFFTKGSKQELGNQPNFVLDRISKHLKNHPNTNIVVLPLRHLPMVNKSNYFGYEFVELITNSIQFDKAIIIDFKPNAEEFSNEELYNINANIVNVNTLCNCPSVFKSFDYVSTKSEVEHKIKEATEFIVENLNKSI